LNHAPNRAHIVSVDPADEFVFVQFYFDRSEQHADRNSSLAAVDQVLSVSTCFRIDRHLAVDHGSIIFVPLLVACAEQRKGGAVDLEFRCFRFHAKAMFILGRLYFFRGLKQVSPATGLRQRINDVDLHSREASFPPDSLFHPIAQVTGHENQHVLRVQPVVRLLCVVVFTVLENQYPLFGPFIKLVGDQLEFPIMRGKEAQAIHLQVQHL